MRILVTGASGNIGTALLQALHGRGHDVRAVVRRPPSQTLALGTTWTSLDLASPGCAPGLRSLVELSDVVVNLAWAFQPMRRPEYLHHASVGILERVVAAVLRTVRPCLVTQHSAGGPMLRCGLRDAHAVLQEAVRGMNAGAGGGTQALRPRRVTDGVRRSLAQAAPPGGMRRKAGLPTADPG